MKKEIKEKHTHIFEWERDKDLIDLAKLEESKRQICEICGLTFEEILSQEKQKWQKELTEKIKGMKDIIDKEEKIMDDEDLLQEQEEEYQREGEYQQEQEYLRREEECRQEEEEREYRES